MSDSTEKMRSPGKTGFGLGTKILLWIIAIVAVVSVIAVVTLTVAVIDSQTGTSFPYSTSYRVSLPDGEPVTIGNTKIIVMVMSDGVDTSVDGSKEKLAVGQERVISPHFARISALGVPLIDTDFQITLKYLGATGNTAQFDMTIKTSKQIPEMVLRRLIPANMNAQPN
jgi:sporulation-control protein spo0M